MTAAQAAVVEADDPSLRTSFSQAADRVAGAVHVSPLALFWHVKVSVVAPLSHETVQVSPTLVLVQVAVTPLLEPAEAETVPTVNDPGHRSLVEPVEAPEDEVVAVAVTEAVVLRSPVVADVTAEVADDVEPAVPLDGHGTTHFNGFVAVVSPTQQPTAPGPLFREHS